MLEEDVEDNAKVVLDRINNIVSSCIERFDEIIDLRPKSFSTPQYIDLIIDSKHLEKRLGFKESIVWRSQMASSKHPWQKSIERLL